MFAAAEVALHEAVWSRSVPCVEALLAAGAPVRPRNTKGETPADLAAQNYATSVQQVLGGYQQHATNTRGDVFVNNYIQYFNSLVQKLISNLVK